MILRRQLPHQIKDFADPVDHRGTRLRSIHLRCRARSDVQFNDGGRHPVADALVSNAMDDEYLDLCSAAVLVPRLH